MDTHVVGKRYVPDEFALGYDPAGARQRDRSQLPTSPEVREGVNRVGASRLQQISDVLGVSAKLIFLWRANCRKENACAEGR